MKYVLLLFQLTIILIFWQGIIICPVSPRIPYVNQVVIELTEIRLLSEQKQAPPAQLIFTITLGLSYGDLCSREALETLPTSTQGRERGLKTRLVFLFEAT